MIIGLLQCGHVPDEVSAEEGPYERLYSALIEGHGFTLRTFSVVDGVFPDGPGAADAWLVSGSRHGAYEVHPWIPPLEALLRQIRDAGQPLVGICFGHQIIAQAFGGTVEKFAGGWSIGRKDYRINGIPVALNAWHQDQVTGLPDGATVIGASDFCANAVITYGDHILTMQPHPEFPASVVDKLIQHRSDTVPAPLKDAAATALTDPIDNVRIGDWIAAVLKGTPATQAHLPEKATA
ncbi:MAG: type 1 glutamine amidotransferase [Octadecabacter sp.]|nr:type 1 glutamine amidotransferase [Octadecabacter sp.]